MTSEQLLHTAILIPSLEPDHRLVTYAKDLENAGFSHRIIVDDGSGESFQPIFTQLEKEGCVVLHHDVNHGKGVALKTGYRWIQENMPECEAVLTADSDGQHTVPDCLSVISKLYDGEDARYLGSRDFSLPNVPPKSRIGNRSTSVVFKLCYGKWLPDTQTGLRAFRASELPFMISIEGDRYEYEMNVLISCARRGLPMIPVTIETVYENGNEGTHFHPIRDSWRIYKLILGSFFKFMGASLICVLVDQVFAGLFASWLLPLLGVTEHRTLVWLSGFLARLISSVVNFTLNKAFVFKMKGSTGHAALRYALLCVLIICLSNLGNIRLPDAMRPYVERVEFVLSSPSKTPYNCSISSWNGTLFCNLVRNTQSAEFERIFFTNLVKEGLHVRIESNDRQSSVQKGS